MALLSSHRKNIGCLESLWDENVEKRLSVAPLLDMVTKNYPIKAIYLSCNTRSELQFNLDLLAKRRNYPIIYLAFHGKIGHICVGDAKEPDLSLEELAKMMGKRFRGRVIYFGTCGTAGANSNDLEAFFERTEVACVMGYTKNVDWIESAAFDLLVLSQLQCYVSLSALDKKIKNDYAGLSGRLGFVCHF